MDQPKPTHNANETSTPGTLPVVIVERPAHEIVEVLEAAAKRGKLAGFQNVPSGVPLFKIRDFGGPYESVLEAFVDQAKTSTLRFQTRLQTKLAWVYLIVLIATVWPGVWLTDSMLRTYFTGYDYKTWMWYLPLTIPTVPWAMWVTVKKSRARAHADAAEIITSIASALGGRVEPARAPGST